MERFGGRPGILSLDAIHGAIGRPYHGYHRRMERKAAALLEAVANSHGFADGNKRTAVILTRLLLGRSRYELLVPHPEALEDLVVQVVCKEITSEELVRWFRWRIVKV